MDGVKLVTLMGLDGVRAASAGRGAGTGWPRRGDLL